MPPITINGTTGIAGVDGSASTPSYQGTDTNTGIFFPAADTIAFGEGGSEAMRIDSSGNVGIGTSSPNSKVSVAHSSTNTSVLGTYANIPLLLQNTSNTDNNWTVIGVQDASGDFSSYIGTQNTSQSGNTAIMAFATNGGSGATERVRITSGGDLLVGATSVGGSEGINLTRSANTATYIRQFKLTQVECTWGFKSSTDTNMYIGSGSPNVGTYGVYLTNTGNSWNAVSDERMKTIVEPIENAVNKVSTLRSVIGYYNNDTNQTRRPFLIAQDVQAVLPEAVNVQDQETGTLGMSYTDTIPLLVAAIKELKAELDAAKARIAVLEAK